MREYELYLVMDADADEDALKAIVERVTGLISAGTGETPGNVIEVEDRGERRLAYPLKKKVEGHDILFTFQSPPQVLPEIERILKLDEQALRYLLVRKDDT